MLERFGFFRVKNTPQMDQHVLILEWFLIKTQVILLWRGFSRLAWFRGVTWLFGAIHAANVSLAPPFWLTKDSHGVLIRDITERIRTVNRMVLLMTWLCRDKTYAAVNTHTQPSTWNMAIEKNWRFVLTLTHCRPIVDPSRQGSASTCEAAKTIFQALVLSGKGQKLDPLSTVLATRWMFDIWIWWAGCC